MTINDKIKISQNVAAVAGVFCVLVAMLLLLNYWQMISNDPIESKALEALVARLKSEPGNEELKAEIRNFDLLARKAYFNSQWQVKTGAWMLLFGGVILAAALRLYYSLKKRITEPDTKHENEIMARILAQKGVVVVGVLIFILAIGASFATVNQLRFYEIENVSGENQVPENEAGQVEVINVAENVAEPEAEVSAEQAAESEEITDAETATADESEPVKEENTSLTAEAGGKPAASKSAALTLESLRANHNAFRGPLGQGIIYHRNIPVKWDGKTGSKILWKTSVPKHGYNSPVVWGNKIFLAGADDQSREIYCFNKNDGKLLWTAKAEQIQGSPSKMPRVTEDTGLSASTLTTDGVNVYAIFATGDVVAFNMEGKKVWGRNLGVPDNHYGHSSSLQVWNNKIIVQYDTNRGGRILALNAANGESIWDKQRNTKISWASPVLASVDGKYQIILTADPLVAGYDLETGKELWNVNAMMGEVGPSVAYDNGIVFAANEYARMVAIDVKTGNIIWENDEYLPEASSPVAHNGLLVLATSYGILVCYDAKTGEQYWEHDVGTTLYSSPVYADGKLYMMDNGGVMRVYEFGKEMKLISENPLGENAGTTPAFDEGRIYIRGEDNLYCIGK